MRKILICLTALVLAICSFTFAFAEANVTEVKANSINIVQEQSPLAMSTVNDFTNDYVDVKANVLNEFTAASSTTNERARPFKALSYQITNRQNIQAMAINYSPPGESRVSFEPNLTDFKTQEIVKVTFAQVNKRHLVQRE